MSWRRIRTLVVREIRATLRDPFTIAILLLTPIFALLVFGSVLSTSVQGLELGAYDGDRTPASRRLLADLAANGTFTITPMATADLIGDQLIDGTLSVGLIIPPGFERELLRGVTAPEVQVLYDGAEAVLAGNAEGFLRGLVMASGGQLARRPLRTGGVTVRQQALFNPRLDGRPFMVAGVFGFVLSFLTTLITAVTIVNERITGTFDQLQVTPATAVEILLGKLIPLGAIFTVDVALMVVVAGVVMGVWPAGNPALFIAISGFYVLLSLSLGLIISASSTSAAEAVQKSVITSIPLIQLSGFLFPVRNMPPGLQIVSQLFPATHYIKISRAIYLRGEGFFAVLPELLILGVFAAVLIFLARRTLEARA
jgi:ABC-2 type transport system permease protein